MKKKVKKKKLSLVFVMLLGAALYLALDESPIALPQINVWQEIEKLNTYYQSGQYEKDKLSGKAQKMDALERVNRSYQTLQMPLIPEKQIF